MEKISVENLNLMIGKKQILKDVNLSVESGKICGLIGRNGSGKTMLMKCICGFIYPNSGTIKVDNLEIGKDVDSAPNTGIIIETPGFIPYYTGLKNLRLLASLQGKIHKQEIMDTMKLVGLEEAMHIPVSKYSLGMRQRLGLAQAIMEEPSLLILDEPMNGLDKEGVEDMRRYLLGLKEEGITMLIASHSAEDISVLCDTVSEMDKGVLQKIR